MKEALENDRRLQFQKWSAGSVSPERRTTLRALGLGDSEENLDAILKSMESALDMLPRGTVHFRESPKMQYRELAIRVQDVREHAEVLRVLENAGLFPWYSKDEGGLEIVVS